MKSTGKIFLVSSLCLLGFLVFAAIIIIARPAVRESRVAALLGTGAGAKNEFSDLKNFKEKLPQKPEEVSLIAVGDVMLSRVVAEKIKSENDPNYPFLETTDYLQSGDIVFGNLEAPITAGRTIKDGEMVFRVDPGMEKVLAAAGFNVLSLANNHIMNFGKKGLLDTRSYLDEAKINYAGAGADLAAAREPALMEKNGLKFSFLAYGYDSFSAAGDNQAGIAPMDIPKMQADVRAAKKISDFVIVSMHAGVEYAGSQSQEQTAFAHAAIDAGAELVIGHHPHVVQTLEKYKDKYIFYSLGNFVFDQMWSEETRQGLTVKFIFSKSGVQKISFSPVLIEDFSQPKFLEGEVARQVTARLNFSLGDEQVFSWNAENNDFESISRQALMESVPSADFKITKKETADLNGDLSEEEYSLENGRLEVSENKKIIWTSPEDWWVDDFVLADSTNDGKTDLNISVWKAGDYGEEKPFWVLENDQAIKNHFFIFDLTAGEMKPLWQSSNLDAPNCRINFSDVDGDGKNELVVLEGAYSDSYQCNGDHAAVWRWNGWGFTNLWRSDKGEFHNLGIEKSGEKSYIIVE